MNELKLEDVNKKIDKEMEQLEDIIEILETLKINRQPMWPEELKALKDAFEAHDSDDWEKCRSALLVYLEYVYDSILFFDLSKWNLRHVFRWHKMLEATKLADESEDDLFLIFSQKLKDQILNRIPSNFRLAYKDCLKDLSPGFIEMLQNFTNDREHSELYNEISDFMEKDIESEAENQSN